MSKKDRIMTDIVFYVFEDAITASIQVTKNRGDLAQIASNFNKFLNMEEFLQIVDNLGLDEKYEYPQFYIVKTYTPQNYIL